ncbi:DUF3352 domain-containing protein [Planctomycetota bacterium]
MRFITKTTLPVIIILSLFSFARAATLPETARLVPSQTALLINVNDFSEVREQFKKTNLYKLYTDPAMADFIEDAREKLHNKANEENNEILRSIVEGNILPEGRISVALVLNDRALEEDEPQAFFLIQCPGSIEKIKELVEDTVRKAIEGGAHQKQEDYRGVSIKTVIAEDGRFSFGFSSSLSFCFIDDCLLSSEDIELLRFAIAHIQGASSPALADDSDYADAVGAMGTEHDINLYVNLKQIIKTVVAEDTTGNSRGTIANLGFDNVLCASGCVDIARQPEASWAGKVFVKINGAKKGICKMFEVESASIEAPRFIPSSVCSISFLNLDIQEAYSELSNIISSLSPMYAAFLYQPLLPPSPDGGMGFALKNDFIDHLGSQIIFASGINKDVPTSQAPLSSEFLIAPAAANAQALEKSLSLLHSKFIAPNNPDAKRELLGHTIYRVSLPSFFFAPPGQAPMQMPADSQIPQLPKFAFTVTQTHLIFGTESIVEQAIRTMSVSEDTSVGSTEWFNTAKSALPSMAGFAELEDTSATFEVLWKMLKNSPKQAEKDSLSVGMGMTSSLKVGPFPAMFLSQGLFDTSLLPEFDVVSKYFGLNVDYLISKPDGFLFDFKSLSTTKAK